MERTNAQRKSSSLRFKLFDLGYLRNQHRLIFVICKESRWILELFRDLTNCLDLLVNMFTYAPSEMAKMWGGTSLRLLPRYNLAQRLVYTGKRL